MPNYDHNRTHGLNFTIYTRKNRMNFTILDPNVDTTMNVFLVIANVLNLVYNIPQVILTCKTKSTNDISSWFIVLRIVGNSIWIAYGFAVQSMLMIVNNAITVGASIIIGYVKIQSGRAIRR